MTAAIAEALSTLDAPGSFAARLRVPADVLRLQIRKLGPVDLPIKPAVVRDMLKLARRSPFGWGEHTITDPRVRSGWQIAKSRVKIDGRRFNPVLREQLEAIRAELGLPEGAKLVPSLDKLTIYGPGEFFAPHQDTEKDDQMIASLVVLLPSRFSGGALRIERQGERREFRRTARGAEQLELLAFYSDCHHEVRAVKSGYRVALVYRLGLELPAGAKVPAPRSPTAGLSALERAVAAHFSTPQPKPYSRDGATFIPEKLVVLLDHQYSAKNLSRSKLKQRDIEWAAALGELAEAQSLELHLALADVHETWQCVPSISSYRGRWYEREEPDEDDDYALDSLVDSDVELRHWRRASGAAARDLGPIFVKDAELCYVTANDELEPFDSRYEGYMGNWGETLERWYHRGAIVLWPRDRAFLVRARLDPHGTLRRLLEELRSGGDEGQIAGLLEIWAECVGREPGAAMVADGLRLAAVVSDADQAAALLGPLRPEQMRTKAIAPLMQATERHGLGWTRAVFEGWCQRWAREPWQGIFPRAWLTKLVEKAGEGGLELARFIVGRQWEELSGELSSLTPARLRSPFVEPRDPRTVAAISELLASCRLVEHDHVHEAILTELLADDGPLTHPGLVDLVEAVGEQVNDEEWARWGYDRLADHARAGLEAELATPQRAKGDWRLTIPQRCGCDDCSTLHEFLSSDEVERVWPLAKARRRHIHGVIDGAKLPVTHLTQRRGSPYKLMLTKDGSLRRLEAKRRKLVERALARLDTLT